MFYTGFCRRATKVNLLDELGNQREVVKDRVRVTAEEKIVLRKHKVRLLVTNVKFCDL